MSYKIVLLFLIGFIIFPKVGGVDFSLFSLFLAFFLSIFKRPSVKVNLQLSLPIIFLAFCWVLLLCVFFINGGYDLDPQFLFKPPRVILIVFMLSIVFFAFKFDHYTICKIIIVSSSINAIVVYLQYILHFLEVTDSFLLNPNVGENALTPYRKPGLMAGYPISGILSLIGSLLSAYLYLQLRHWSWKFSFFVVGFACFLTSRTSLYLFIFAGIPYYLWILFSAKQFSSVVTMLFLSVAFFSWVFTTDDPLVRGSVNKMFANIIGYMETGSVHDYSTSDLVENHYQLPARERTLWVGTSKPNRMNEVNSDVSFFRMTWYAGIVVSLFFIFIFSFVLLTMCLNSPDRNFFWASFLIFFIMIVANAKGSYVFSRVLGDALLLLWVCLVYRRKV